MAKRKTYLKIFGKRIGKTFTTRRGVKYEFAIDPKSLDRVMSKWPSTYDVIPIRSKRGLKSVSFDWLEKNIRL
jgi:hypothetical protein